MTECGLVVLVPEADALIQSVRHRYLDGPALTVPAHITVLFPFVSPPFEHDTVERVAELCSRLQPFEFSLTDVGWFGDEVLFLAPEPDSDFRASTRSFLG